jgi:Cu/Ag efflux pump CusA
MPLVIVAIGIVALLVLIMGLKLNTFVSLIIVSFGVAIALGMKLDEIIATIEVCVYWFQKPIPGFHEHDFFHAFWDTKNPVFEIW